MITCTCGRPLDARHLHATHQHDGDVSVLELYTCRHPVTKAGCGNTKLRQLPGPVAGCACPGCDEARASRCRSCPAPVEPGHVRCSACRDELAIRRADARGVGEGFAAVRAARSRRMGERRSA